MKYIIIIYTILTGLVFSPAMGQQSKNSETDYQLYLTQIAAAEAFLQLNQISTAKKYLDACDIKFRDVEWRFLNSFLDQSKRSITKPGCSAFSTVKFSPNGKVVAIGGSDSLVTLYTYPDFSIIRELKGHKAAVNTIAFSNDGKKLASGGRDHTIMIWDVESGRLLAMNEHSFSQGIYQLCFSQDDSRLGVVSWERIKERKPGIFGFLKLLNVADAGELLRIELDNHPAAGVVFTPDAKHVIVSTWGEITYSFDLLTGNLNWKYDLSDPKEYNAFHSIAISPDGSVVAVGSTDHDIHLLHTADGTVIHRIDSRQGHKKIVKSLAFSPDGKSLASAGEDQTLLIWNTGDFTKRIALVGHTSTVSALSWSPNSNALLSSSSDGQLKEWKVDRPFELKYKVCNYGPWQTPFTMDKKYFISPCSDEKLVLYEAATGKEKVVLGKQSGLAADISKNGEQVVTGSFDGIVRLWDLSKAMEVKTFTGHSGRVDGVAYLNATQQVISAGDTTLRVWNCKSTEEPKILSFNASLFRIVLSPDESIAMVSLSNNKIVLLNTTSWKEVNSITCNKSIQELTISPDGKLLAVFCGNTIEVWSLTTSELLYRFTGHEKSGYGISFSPDNRYLISGAYDQTFRLWNLSSGECTLTYHGYEETVYSCKILSDHELFISTGEGWIKYYRF